MKRALLLSLAMLASPALASLPPWIIPPVIPAPPVPPPKPVDPVVQLAADELFVLDCKEPCFFVLSAASSLEVMQASGPATFFAKFYGGGKIEMKTFAGPTVIVVRASGQGRSTLTVVKSGAQKPTDVFSQTFDTGPPVPPVPPAPPVPPPGPAPIPEPGFRVLIVYETAELAKMSKGQLDTLYSTEMRSYCDNKCVRGPDGVTPEFRCWDKDTPTAAASAIWRNAMARPRTGVPWLLISTGKDGYEGPLPATFAETMALLRKYGG